jgi:uncharacterized repeat protein (TIGR04138 family)
MLGQPDPIVPVHCEGTFTKGSPGELERTGFVSLWVGTFASIEDAEAYFGIPDEIGVYIPADAFIRDFSLGNFPLENLEVNFEQLTPRPLRELVQVATFASSFVDQALQAAAEQSILQAQGIALLYDFDDRRKTARCDAAGPLRFVSAFPYAKFELAANSPPFYEVAQQLGCPPATVIFVLGFLREVGTKRSREGRSEPAHVTAQEYCDYLLTCRDEDTSAILGELGLRRSEDVGRVITALVNRGLASRHESDTESDFDGLFVLD